MPAGTASVRERDLAADNAADLERELEWLARALDARIKHYLSPERGPGDVLPPPERGPGDVLPPPPSLDTSCSPYARLLREQEVPTPARLSLLLALAPHLRPQLLDFLWTQNETTQRGLTELGGARGATHGGFLPTGETAVFLLAGDDLSERLRATRLFDADGVLSREDLVRLAPVSGEEPRLSGALLASPSAIARFASGRPGAVNAFDDLPARRLATRLSWEDLVLPAATLDQLAEILAWTAEDEGASPDEDRPRAGMRALLCGPAGTGKRLSVALLGARARREVREIVLREQDSTYSNERERALDRLFDVAARRGWILFLDGIDPLLGGSEGVEGRGAGHDPRELRSVLRRAREHRGLVVFSSRRRPGQEDPLLRDVDAVIPFPVPRLEERLRLWQRALSGVTAIEGVDPAELAERHDITGGTIERAARRAGLIARARGAASIALADVEEALRRERLRGGSP